MGPVINARQVAMLSGLVADAENRGAKIACGGRRIGNRGSFFAPTVLADVPLDAKAMTEEPFGPLALCRPVDDMREALGIANSLSVGLAGYAFTNSPAETELIMRELQCGSVAINNFGSPGADAPFGGLKESGIGKEGGEESLDAYTTTRTIMHRTVRI
jgi:succinate-semialdehyde dehydrogenase/glutarate-semialdehyde dehydrogenase